MKISLNTLLISCFLILIILPGFLFGDARQGVDQSRPLYAADRIKIKLGPEAIQRSALPTGLYAEASSFGINELDQIYSRNGGERIIRAHRRVRDTAWEAKTGFDRWFVIRLDGRSSVEEAISSFKANRYVEDAIPEYFAYTTAVPNDTYYANNWGHNNTAQLPYNHTGAGVGTIGFDSRAQLAWDQSQGYGSASVIIAIIDTGVDTAHPDLRLVTGYDYGDNDSNPMDNCADPGHGTACSGVAAGIANNGLGVTGVAGGCSVMPLKIANTAGDLLFTAIENALIHAGDNNVDVASMSFGAEEGMAQGSSPSTDAALEYAYSHGVTLFAATANSNASALAYPANHNKVISVGAASPTGQRKSKTSSDGENWWGSNYGVNIQNNRNSVDIMAPTILPATDITGTAGYDPGNYSMWFNGTSCATPYAAGVAALLISKDSSLTPAQVRTALTANATDMTFDGGVGWDQYTGYGMVNANNSLLGLYYALPQNLTFTAGNSYVDLSWKAPGGVTPTNYKIYRNSVFLTTVSSRTHLDTSVVNEQTYAYYVKAVYPGGESEASNIVEATPTATIFIEGIIGTGTGSNGTTAACPVNVYWQSLHGQSVYTVAELNATGIYGPTSITQIGFNVSGLPTRAMPSYVVRMGHTNSSNVSSWISEGLEIYWTSSSYQPNVTGWNMFNLSAPFAWDGTSNIVIDTAFGLIGSYASTGTTQYTSVTNGYCFARNDYTDQTNVFSGGSTSTNRPNIKILAKLPPAPQPVPFVESFESGIGDWLTANGTQTNAWACGTAISNTGAKGVYISKDSGISNNYDTGSTAVSHLYRDISFPAGSDSLVLRFNWKGMGQSNTDYMRVYLVDVSTTPIAGTALASGQIGDIYHQQSSWQETTIELPAGLNGLNKRLVFSWVNNNNTGTNPPAALDDIRIVAGTQSDAAVVIGNTVNISPPDVTDLNSNVIDPSLVITNFTGNPSFIIVTSGYNSPGSPSNSGLDFLFTGANFAGAKINFTYNLGFIPYQLAYQLGDSGNWIVVNRDTNWTSTSAFLNVPESKAETDLRVAFSNSDEGTLPVELSSFNALLVLGNQVRLNWVTATETGLLGYNIYRHTQESLESAELISELISGTNTSTEQHYIFTDNETNSGTSYYYWLQGLDLDGWIAFYGPVNIKTNDDIDTNPPIIPIVTELRDNYPNPFNPSTTLRYSLLSPAKVKIDIYNCRGQLVRGFAKEHNTAGFYSLVFDGKDSGGNKLGSGVYIYRMRSGEYDYSRRMLMTK